MHKKSFSCVSVFDHDDADENIIGSKHLIIIMYFYIQQMSRISMKLIKIEGFQFFEIFLITKFIRRILSSIFKKINGNISGILRTSIH